MSDELLEKFPEEDQAFLRNKGAKLFEGPGLIYVVLDNEPIGPAYNPSVTNVMFQVPFGYPGAAMDI